MAKKKNTRRGKFTSISEETVQAMRDLSNRTKHVHPEIWARWYHIAGEQMYRRTFPLMLKGGTLTIGVSSSAWLQELNMLKPRLIDRLADQVGEGVVTEIRMIQQSNIGKSIPAQYKPETREEPECDITALPDELKKAADRIEDRELASSIKRAAAMFQKKK